MDKTQLTYKDKLISQIRDAHGKVTYSERMHIEQYLFLEKLNKRIKYARIVLSAISISGFICAVVVEETIAVWVGGIFAILLLAINLFYKDFNVASDMSKHRAVSDGLWLIRERYVSLLTDFESLDDDEIIRQRDELQTKTGDVYKDAPKTGKSAFAKAQNALKINSEQFFSDDELNKLLPEHLRFSKDTE